MLDFIAKLSRGRLYWLLLVVFGLALEAGALYYQYALDEWPCVLCIHVRILVFAFILIGILALLLSESVAARRLLHGLNTVVMLWLMERSYQVLAVERGWVFGDCDMELGMPAWFALDKWFPAIFEVQTSCGYSPYILFEITMAETMMVTSILLALASLVLFIASFFKSASTA